MKKFNIKESFRKGVKNKRLRHGSYSMGLALIVLAIIVVINMAVNALPSKFREFDLTGQNLTQIGSQTTEMLDALTKDVQIYLWRRAVRKTRHEKAAGELCRGQQSYKIRNPGPR